MKKMHFSNLDILRMLAALWVVMAHYFSLGPDMARTSFTKIDGFMGAFADVGYIGVPIFFALSGFLIAYVSENRDAASFVRSRILRLIPTFWVCMTLSFIIIALFGSDVMPSLTLWLANLTLLPQIFGHTFVDGVYWTLFFEFVFYGWVFVFIVFDVFHRHILKISAAWLAICLGQFAFPIGGAAGALLDYLLIADYGCAFIVGLLFWHGRKHGFAAIHVLLLTGASIGLALGIQQMSADNELIANQVMMPYNGAYALGLLVIVSLAAGLWLPQIQFGKAHWALLGAISYPLYLLHQEIGYIFLSTSFAAQMPIAASALMLAITTVIAWQAHSYWQKPIHNLLDRLITPVIELFSAFGGRLLRWLPIPATESLPR